MGASPMQSVVQTEMQEAGCRRVKIRVKLHGRGFDEFVQKANGLGR